MLDQVLFSIANGLATGMAVFLVAAGVTLIFGLFRILNFAQGSFFMLGAYIAFSIMGPFVESMWTFLAAALVGGVVVAALGLLTDLVVFRRLRDFDEAYALIATFALMLALDGVIKLVWGINYHSINPPAFLGGVMFVGPVIIPYFSIFIIAVGLLTFVALDLVIHRMWVGKIVQALAHDRWMSGFLGINVPLVMTITVMVSFLLAGMAGGLLLPNQSLAPSLSHAYLLQAFIVVIIGGLGNIRGAFLASIVLGLAESLNSVVLPAFPGITMYIAMIAFLLWRPGGILKAARGRDEHAGHQHSATAVQVDWDRYRKALFGVGVAAALVVAAMPFWANPGMLYLASVALIAALFALSWNLLFGTTGLATFGHAAFFAIGAYVCGLMLKVTNGEWFPLILLVTSLAGGAVAAIVGSIALRRTAGITLAILTLALTEVMRLLISSSSALGRDDGLPGIPRPDIDLGIVTLNLQSTSNYFWFVFVVCLVCALGLWWLTAGRLGRVLRAIRQDPERTSFVGVNVTRYRVIAFVISGTVATLAGALQAPLAQIVTPAVATYLVSIQPMLSSLLGGAAFFWGPVVGTMLFFILEQATHALAGLSEMLTGMILLVIVLLAPDGVLGIAGRLRWPDKTGRRDAAKGVEARESLS